MEKKQLRPVFSPTTGRPLIKWNLHESIRTTKLFWDQKFSSTIVQNSFVRLAILDWNELPSEIKIKKDKKSFPKQLRTFFCSANKMNPFCGRLLVQHGVTLNLEK